MTQDQESILDRIISAQQVSHREHFKPREVLDHLLQKLSDRERQVVQRRFGLLSSEGEEETLDSIGRSFQVTRERIRQIERFSVQRLREGREAQALIEPVRHVVLEVIENDGGVVPAERLERTLVELSDGASANVIRFYLREILEEVVVPVGDANGALESGWAWRTASVEALMAIIVRAQDIIAARAKPMTEDELSRELLSANLTTPLGAPLKDGRLAFGLLELSRQVRRNTFGEWGLRHWETITPKRMNDKIYLVLKKHGQPLHFREITRLINEAKFDHKVAYPPTVHNELILDQRYVLVGRGTYALREWGFEPGVVADVIVRILERRGPLSRDEVVAEVMKQRAVKRGTIHLALTNRQHFTRLPDGRYTIAGATPAT